MQSLLFARPRWTAKTATRWASSHGFATDSVDVKPATIRLRQWDPAEGDASTFRTIPFGEGEGIQAVVATRTRGVARAKGDPARSPAAVYDAILTLAERANPALAAWMLPRKELLIQVIAEVLHEKRAGEAFAAMFPRAAREHAEVRALLEQVPLDWPRLDDVLEAHAQFEDGVLFPHLRARGVPDAVLRAAAHATSEHPGIRGGARARDPGVLAKILHHFDEEERDLYGPAALAGFGEPPTAQLPRAGTVHYVVGDVFSFVNDTPVTLGPDYAASSDYRRTFTPKDIVYVQRVEPGTYVVRRANGATMDHYLRYADADREAIDVDVSDALGPAILDLKRREKPWLANAVAAPFERYVRTGDAAGLLEARDALGRKGWSTAHDWMAPLLTRGHELALNPRPAPVEIGTLPANEAEAMRALRWARDAAIRGRQAGRDVTRLDGWVHALRTHLITATLPPPAGATELPAPSQPPLPPTPAAPPDVRDIAELGLSQNSPVGDLLRAAEPRIGPIFARLFAEGGLLVQPDGAYMDAAWNLYGALAVHGWLGRRGFSTKGSSGFITDAWNRWPEAHRPNLPDPFGIPAEDWNRGGRNVGKSEAVLEDALNQQVPDLAPWHVVEATRGGALGDWHVAIRSRGPGVSAVHALGTGDTRVAAMRSGVESRNLHRAVWAHRIGRYFNGPDGKALGKLIEALAPSSEPASAPPEEVTPDVVLVPEQFEAPELPQPPQNAATGPSPERQRELVEERERMRAKLGRGTLGAQAQARSRIREINAELAGNADQKAIVAWLRARARKSGGAFDADLAEAAFRHMPGWTITPTTTLLYVNANTNDAVRHTINAENHYALVAEDYAQKGWWHFEGAEGVQFVKVPGDAKGKPVVDDPIPGTFYVTDGPKDGMWGSTPTKRVKSPAIGVAAWVVKAPNGASTLVTDKPRSPSEPLTADSFWKWAYASATYDRATGITHGATGLDTAAAAALPAVEAAVPRAAILTAHPHGYDTCSVCFGSHALAKNEKVKDAGINPETGKPWVTIMDHGYRRPGWGYNVEPCPGTRYPPYPASPAGTKAYLRGLEAAAAGIPTWIEALKAGAHLDGSRVEVTVKAYATDPKTGKRIPETDQDKIARYGEWKIEDVRVFKGHKLWSAVQRDLIGQSKARLRSLWGVIPFYRAAVRVWAKGHTGADIREAEEDRRGRPDALLGPAAPASEGGKPAAPESPAPPASEPPSAKKITVELGGQQGDYIVADGFRARQTATGGNLGEVIAKALKHYHDIAAEPPTPELVGALTRRVDTDRKASIAYNPATGSWSSPPPAAPPAPPEGREAPPALTDVPAPPGWAGREAVWHELDPDAPVGVEGKKTPHRRFVWSKGRVSVFLDWPGTKVSPDRFGVSVLENGHEHVPRGPKLDTFEAARDHAVAVMRGYAKPSEESSPARDWRRTDSARLDYGEAGAAQGNTRGTHAITASQMETLWDSEGETAARTRFLIARVKTPAGDRYGILAAWDNPRVGGAPGVAAVGMAEDGTTTLRLVRPMDGFEMTSAKPEVFGFDTREDAARFAETLLDQRIATVRALPNRGLWPDGRAVAVPGDKVYRSARGFGGTAASVGGTVYLKSGAKPVDGELHHVENLRVRDLTVQALIGGGVSGPQTQSYDHNWTLNDDPWVSAQARQRATYEPIVKAKKQAKYDRLAALDREANARMISWHAEHGQDARVASLREGDVVEFYKPAVVDDDRVEDVLEQLPVTAIRPATEDDPVADARAGAGTWFRDYVPDDRTVSGDWPWRVVSRAAPKTQAPAKPREPNRVPYPWVAAVLERAQAALGVELDTAQALGQGANGQVFAVREERS